jgi:nicotinamide phosphoribosyltransferase
MFKPISLFYSDGYKAAHKRMLAKGITRLYGTWIPRSTKYAPGGIKKILSFGQQLVVRWLHDEFQEHFFSQPKDVATKFSKDMSLYLGMDYDGSHFEALHEVGYLPIKIKSLPEGIETNPNIPHMTFINTIDGFAWLTLYLETIISSLAWKPTTSATIALQYRRNLVKWVMKTDPANAWLIAFLAHDFSARGLSPWDMLSSGLGHASSFRGSDSIIVIPGARYFYDEPENEVCINSVNASEHSVSTTRIFSILNKLESGELDSLIEEYENFKK